MVQISADGRYKLLSPLFLLFYIKTRINIRNCGNFFHFYFFYATFRRKTGFKSSFIMYSEDKEEEDKRGKVEEGGGEREVFQKLRGAVLWV